MATCSSHNIIILDKAAGQDSLANIIIAKLDVWKGNVTAFLPHPFIAPEAPGGSKWERNLPPPPHVSTKHFRIGDSPQQQM